MTSKIAMMVAKYLAREIKKRASEDEPDRGEWRGDYTLTPVGEDKWWCDINPFDPLRYCDHKTGLEFSPAILAYVTDKGSIPKPVRGIQTLGLQLQKDDAERSYIMHDGNYQSGKVRVRKPDAEWVVLTITQEQADVLLHDGLSADSTPSGEPITKATAFAVYQAVRRFSGRIWNKYRWQDKSRGRALAEKSGGELPTAQPTEPTAPVSEAPAGQRIGTIIIATEAVEKSWEMLCQTLFVRFCPFAIHVSPDGAKRAYVGFCQEFDEIPADEEPPRYLVSVERSTRGETNVSFTRYQPDAPAGGTEREW